jgi:hypothetical protein
MNIQAIFQYYINPQHKMGISHTNYVPIPTLNSIRQDKSVLKDTDR